MNSQHNMGSSSERHKVHGGDSLSIDNHIEFIQYKQFHINTTVKLPLQML